MKIITLNLWGGKLYEPLMAFVEKHSGDTDIFCFQDALFGSKPEFTEIQKGRVNLFSEIEKRLPDFHSTVYRDPAESYFHGELLPLEIGCGQVMFIRKSLQIMENGGFRSHPDSPYHKGGDMVSGRCQWVKLLSADSENITVLNLHGLWQRNSKKADTKERLEQSEKINEFFKSADGKKILCGDFNIIPDGQAMKMFEEGMVNLVKKYNIASTRSSHYPKEEKFADYILVSPDITVNDFKVLPDEVSDHLPLMLDFE
jgi:exonuclease III